MMLAKQGTTEMGKKSEVVCSRLGSYGTVGQHRGAYLCSPARRKLNSFNPMSVYQDQIIFDQDRIVQTQNDPTRPLLEFEIPNEQDDTKKTVKSPNYLFGSKFRYFIGILVIAGHTMHIYANYTLFILAMEMISDDVLSNGLTGLRAKHMALDPLAENTNVAATGTCPIKATRRHFTLSEIANATFISRREHIALAVDSVALFTDVITKVNKGKLVDWTINQRGIIFTAQTLGSLLFSVPLSRLGLVYGSKTIIMIGLSSSALRAFLFPVVAGHMPFWLVLIFELVMGSLGYGISAVAYPLAAAWLLPDEANAFIAFASLAGTLGHSLTDLISTQISAHHIDWPWCFYLSGFVLTIITVAWFIFGADRPEKSKFVSPYEMMILKNSVANSNKSTQIELSDLGDIYRCLCNNELEKLTCPAKNLTRTPNWSAFIRCPTIWALVAVNFAANWNAKMATLWPTYFANILHLDSPSVGILTGLKGAVGLVYGSLFAYGTRKLTIERPFNISLTTYRRVCYVISTLIFGISITIMTVFDCNLIFNTISIMLTSVVIGFNVISFAQLPLDLSPEDSGLVISYVRTLAIGDIIALPISSYVLSFATNSLVGDRPTWRVVWLLGLAIKVVTCLVFILFAKAEPRSYSRVTADGPCKSKICRH